MRHKRNLGTTSIEYRIHALNQFFRANGVPVEDPYRGIRDAEPNLHKDIQRAIKASAFTLKE